MSPREGLEEFKLPSRCLDVGWLRGCSRRRCGKRWCRTPSLFAPVQNRNAVEQPLFSMMQSDPSSTRRAQSRKPDFCGGAKGSVRPNAPEPPAGGQLSLGDYNCPSSGHNPYFIGNVKTNRTPGVARLSLTRLKLDAS